MKSLAEQIRDRCIHFTGIQNDVCDAGVPYMDVRTDGKGIPCLRGNGISGKRPDGACLSCSKREWPTEEAIAEQVAARDMAMERTLLAMRAIRQDCTNHGYGKGSGGRGQLSCPACDGGTLHYSVSGYNGHIHAQCTTEGCVRFMQ